MTLHLGTPQIVLLVFIVLEFCAHCRKAGEPRGPYNPAGNFLNALILIAILWWGGFWG